MFFLRKRDRGSKVKPSTVAASLSCSYTSYALEMVFKRQCLRDATLELLYLHSGAQFRRPVGTDFQHVPYVSLMRPEGRRTSHKGLEAVF